MKRVIALLLLLGFAAGAQAAATTFSLSRATVWYIRNGDILDTAAGSTAKITGTMSVDGSRLVQKITATVNGQSNTVTLTGTVLAYDGVSAKVRDDRGPTYVFVIVSNSTPFITLAATGDYTEVDQWTPTGGRSADAAHAPGTEYLNPPGVALGDLPAILHFLESVQR